MPRAKEPPEVAAVKVQAIVLRSKTHPLKNALLVERFGCVPKSVWAEPAAVRVAA